MDENTNIITRPTVIREEMLLSLHCSHWNTHTSTIKVLLNLVIIYFDYKNQ